jgi:hypothetical protein
MTLRYAIAAVALLCAAGCAQDDQPKHAEPEFASGKPLTVWMGPHDTNIPPQCENWHCQCTSAHC